MLLPHVITVYNRIAGKQFQRTVISGVLVDIHRAANRVKTGSDGADSATVYIPFSADFGGKTYLSNKKYEAEPDKSGVFTLREEHDFFVKGISELEGDFQTVNAALDDVYRIVSVTTRDYGNLSHWEVGGR